MCMVTLLCISPATTIATTVVHPKNTAAAADVHDASYKLKMSSPCEPLGGSYRISTLCRVEDVTDRYSAALAHANGTDVVPQRCMQLTEDMLWLLLL